MSPQDQEHYARMARVSDLVELRAWLAHSRAMATIAEVELARREDFDVDTFVDEDDQDTLVTPYAPHCSAGCNTRCVSRAV